MVNAMAIYQYSVLILFSPLLAFAVIIFGTRVWDMLSRPKMVATSAHPSEEHEAGHPAAGMTHGEEHTAAATQHGDPHGSAHIAEEEQEAARRMGANLDDHGESDDDDPKVAHLSAGARASSYVGLALMAFAAIYSWVLLFYSAFNESSIGTGVTVFSYTWFAQGPASAASYIIQFRIDPLAIAMLVVVTTVSLLVNFYSQGYMSDSAGYSRFYSYLALFTFSMLVIVFAANFLVIFIGWELVGLSSYLLIGFWYNKRAKPVEQRPAPAGAAIQAFIMNRIGDVGYIIGIMILFANLGTFDFATLFSRAASMDKTVLTIAMICIFCGAIGKSAQFPLYTWLPSAMEGPTPVSALIHAATMVAAGVYMVARVYPLFVLAGPVALNVVAWVGAFTALYAATIALVQSDFKRVLAFSTISQLGYMFVGLGVASLGAGPGTDYYGSVGPGMFHLFTHAFFKALLFLGAGSVLHALHHATHKEVQDMRLMGGLAKSMPVTALTWLIATLAISGFPGFAGFYSKDTIIGLAAQHGQWGLYVVTLGTAGLTAFYMLRAYILAFGGRDGAVGGLWGGTYRGVGEVHESPLTMTIPLGLLAVASIVAGYWFTFFHYLQPGQQNIPALSISTVFTDPLTYIGIAVSLIGLAVAYVMYARLDQVKLHNAVENNGFLRFLHRLLYNRYYVDTLYNWIAMYVVLGISHIEQAFDTYVVDGIVNGVARLVTVFGRDIRYTETGRVQSYMIGFFGGVVVLAALAVVLVLTR
jgi:proton-translocating NADH-quinone oxidoreductase chain L